MARKFGELMKTYLICHDCRNIRVSEGGRACGEVGWVGRGRGVGRRGRGWERGEWLMVVL